MSKQIFQAERFSNYFKKFIYERRTSLAVTTALFILIEIAFCAIYPYLLGTYLGKGDYYNAQEDPFWRTETKFFMIFLICAAIGCGTSMFEVLRKKNDRIVLFTTPASSFEKFTSYFLIYFLFLTAVAVGGMFLADAVKVWIYSSTIHTIDPQYIPASYLLTTGKAWYLTFPGIAPEEYEMLRNNMLLNVSLYYGMFLVVFALFTLGGTIWTKKALTKTLMFAWFLLAASIALFYLGAELFYRHGTLVPNNFLHLSYAQASALIFCFLTVVAAFTLWLSYARFKEWEVIRRW